MKKFTTTFFLLMAMVLLLPTEMKAEDVYLLCNADGADWTTETGLKFKLDGGVYKLNVPASKITNDGNQLRFRVAVSGWGGRCVLIVQIITWPHMTSQVISQVKRVTK